jgi:putative membrane protein
MTIQERFSTQDLERIKTAVREAESTISGEIVPVFVEKSGVYHVATYRAGLICAAFVFLLIIIFDRYLPALAVYDPMLIFIIVLSGGLLGGLLTHYVSPIKKLVVSQSHLDEATRRRAESIFLEEEVFNTRQRTGILIFISFFEHEVIIMSDKGISKLVDQKEWDTLVQSIITQIKKGNLTEGIVHAIKRCGDILLEQGFEITPDDVNELKDDLRLE